MNYLDSMQEMCDEYRKSGGNFAKFAISKEKEIGSWRYATENELIEALKILSQIDEKCRCFTSKLKTQNITLLLSMSILILCFSLLSFSTAIANLTLLLIVTVTVMIAITVYFTTFISKTRLSKSLFLLEGDRRVCNSCIQSKQDYDRINAK
jgi:hypothetical protein